MGNKTFPPRVDSGKGLKTLEPYVKRSRFKAFSAPLPLFMPSFHAMLRFILQCVVLDLFDRLADIKIDRTVNDAASATHTGDPIKVLREIIKLMH